MILYIMNRNFIKIAVILILIILVGCTTQQEDGKVVCKGLKSCNDYCQKKWDGYKLEYDPLVSELATCEAEYKRVYANLTICNPQRYNSPQSAKFPNVSEMKCEKQNKECFHNCTSKWVELKNINSRLKLAQIRCRNEIKNLKVFFEEQCLTKR